MRLSSVVKSDAARRDPGRLVLRRLLWEFERRRSSASSDERVECWLTAATRIGYRRSELLCPNRYLYGVHEFVGSAVFTGILEEGMLVADVGANLGEYTVLAGRGVGRSGRVVACEPNPVMVGRLEDSVALNGLSNVTIVRCAVGSTLGTATLNVNDRRPGESSVVSGAVGTRPITVPMTTLDDTCREQRVKRLDVLKIDVEGFELEVLHGGSATIESSRPAIMVEIGAKTLGVRDGAMRTDVLDHLLDKGYLLYGACMSRDLTWRLEQLTGTDSMMRYRQPWETLTLWALHPQSPGIAMHGPCRLRPCGRLELLGRRRSG